MMMILLIIWIILTWCRCMRRCLRWEWKGRNREIQRSISFSSWSSHLLQMITILSCKWSITLIFLKSSLSHLFRKITLLYRKWSITLIMRKLSFSSSSWPYHLSQMITLSSFTDDRSISCFAENHSHIKDVMNKSHIVQIFTLDPPFVYRWSLSSFLISEMATLIMFLCWNRFGWYLSHNHRRSLSSKFPDENCAEKL